MTTSKQVKHLHADVIIAWANGAKVQNSENGIDWYDCVGSPGWSPCTKYRVKPKPLVKKWRWVISDIRNDQYFSISSEYFSDQSDFLKKHMHGPIVLVQHIPSTMIEVEED
jgi:hypothetical protein